MKKEKVKRQEHKQNKKKSYVKKKQTIDFLWKEEDGAITIFAALIFLVLLVFFFALIEGIYINTAKSRIKRSLESAMVSILGDYNIPLWERYGILAIDKNYGQNSDGYLNVRLEGFTKDQFLAGENYGESKVTTMIMSVNTLTEDDLQGLKTQVDEQGKEDIRRNMEELVVEIPKSQGDYSEVTKEYSEEEQKEGMVDPRQSLQELLEDGILNIVIDDLETLSNLELDPEKITVSNSSVLKIDLFKEETFPELMNMDVTDIKNNTGNAVAYAMEHFGWYKHEKEENTGLSYEIEYLLEKKGSDKENLEAVANDLVGIRYGFNLVYVLGDAELCAQAEAIAVALAAQGGPVTIETVKYGLLCTLAYAESVYDVKTLFSGGKVPLEKTKGNFRMSIENIGEVPIEEIPIEEDFKEGFDYSQYLMMLCMLHWSEEIDYPAINELIEYNLRLEDDEFRMENCICGFSAQAKLDLDRKYNAFEIGGQDLYHLITYYQVEY